MTKAPKNNIKKKYINKIMKIKQNIEMKSMSEKMLKLHSRNRKKAEKNEERNMLYFCYFE